MNKIQN